MNKAIVVSFTILCLLSTLFVMQCKISINAYARVIHVPTEHPTIQEAINNAIDGDTIFVHTGTYYEHVIVNKSVSLVGEERDLTIIDGDGTGSVVKINASNVRIESLTINGSGTRPDKYDSSIYVDRYSSSHISHNTITNSYYGISIHSSSDNVISDNTIFSNNYDGISLYSSINNTISSNTITNNYDGISLYSSGSNVVSGNTISSNYYCGIILHYYGNNVVSDNTITNNDYGIFFFDSDNNVFFNNNFVENTQQVDSFDSINVWDDGVEGNYWDNYTGVDVYSGPYQNINGSDGIGDTPHNIASNNQDNYPLMGTFSYFNIALEKETYYVTVICNSTISNLKYKIGPETQNKIIHFNATGENSTTGFCRVRIPRELMNYTYVVLVGVEEIDSTLLSISNETYDYLYFTYGQGSHTITIVSSKTLYLYNELFNEHVRLNATFYALLNDFSVLLGNYSQLQEDHQELNNSYQEHLNNYSILLGIYGILVKNYSQLQEDHQELNNSYQEHLSDYSQNVRNNRNLTYIFAATTAILIMTTIYLSKQAHAGKTKVFEEKK